MKIKIKGILKETEDKKDRYYDKLSKVIRPPYFVDLQSLGVTDDEWDKIFSRLFKQPVRVSSFYLDNKLNGGVVIDKETNILYNEGDGGQYVIREFDKNNNVTYKLIDDGFGKQYWEKTEYNDKGEVIKYRTSDGSSEIDNINESKFSDKLVDKILNTLKPPFRYDLESLGIPRDEWDGIISKVFNEDLVMKDIVDAIYVTNIYGEPRYMESRNGNYFIDEYDDYGNVIYKESNYVNSDDIYKEWFTYDDRGENLIDYKDSRGRGLNEYLKSTEYIMRRDQKKRR